MKSKKITIADYKPVSVLNPYSLEQDKVLKAKIKQAANSIKRKWLALKLGKAEEDETLNRLLKPVIDPLKELKSSIPTKILNQNIKHKYKPKQEKDEDEEEEEEFKDAVGDFDLNEMLGTLKKYFDQFPPLARHYIEGYFNKRKDYDETYGVKFDLQANKLYLGNKELKIDQDSQIIIDNEIYGNSQGLYNLLFMKHPTDYDYTESDLTDYKNILQVTSVHKRNYNPLGQFKGTNAFKYTKIIKPLFKAKKNKKILMEQEPQTKVLQPIDSTSASTSGAGMMNMVYNKKPIEYVYWDDVNELVDRLRLLNSSKMAGNTDSHDNEILAIISELREAGIIL